MESSLSTNESEYDTSLDTIGPKRKKRRVEQLREEEEEEAAARLNRRRGYDYSQNAWYQVAKRWRTERVQQIYSSKLLQAIRHVSRTSSSSSSGNNSGIYCNNRGKQIRDAANRVLAVSARGATRWSRAIHASQPLCLRRLKKRNVKVCRLRRQAQLEVRRKRTLLVVEKKLRVLSRLIPGCRKVSSVDLLEEASDYIAALEMQVRAMTALTDILAGAAQTVADPLGGSNAVSS